MSSRYSSQLIDQICSKTSLSLLVARKTKLVRAGRLFKGPCPFHREKSPSFVVYEDQGTYHCFGCGAHGNAISFLIELEGYNFIEAVKYLADQAGVELPKLSRRDDTPDKPRLPLLECLEEATRWFEKQLTLSHGSHAKDYILKRKFDPKWIKKFRLGYAPPGHMLKQHLLKQGFTQEAIVAVDLMTLSDDQTQSYDRFRDRLMFPIWNKQGQVIAFGGRTLSHREPKYLNSRETVLFSKGHELYGYHLARKTNLKDTQIIVCEGYTDVIALHQMGYPGAVASLGTALTEHQIALLWRLNSHPLLCFDGDRAGQQAAFRAAERSLGVLKPEASLDFVSMSAGDDPASLLESGRHEALNAKFSQKQSIAELLWSREVFGRTFDSPEQRAALDKRLQDYVHQIQDVTTKVHYKKFFKEKMFEFFQPRAVKAYMTRSAKAWSRPRIDVTKIQCDILLSTIINHPTIWHDVFEHFESLDLTSTETSALKQCLIQKFNCDSRLDFSTLQTYLIDQGFENVLKGLNDSVALHAPFALPHVCASHALKDGGTHGNYIVQEYKHRIKTNT